MRRHAIERFFIAYAVGALLGALALVLEVLTTRASFSWPTAAVYSLLAGSVAAISRSLLALVLPASAARMGAAAVIGAFAALHLLYYVNVKVLPGEPYFTRKSLIADAVVLLFVTAPALALCRSYRAQELRERWGLPVAALGVLFLVGATLVVADAWPPNPLAPERGGKGPDLLLVVVDSLRADRTQASADALRATPALHRIATSGRAYDQTFSSSSWTVPSVRHMLGADGAGSATLAERLVQAGYATACFTDNPHLPSGSPILRGFDRVDRSVRRWRRLLHDTVIGEFIERADPGSDAALATKAVNWERRRSGPWFVYVHLMDAHTPYRFAPIDGRRRGGRRVQFPVSGMKLTQEERDDIVARYDGGVLRADAQVGRLVDALRASGRPYLAVITADHGESLGESGRWFHGGSLAPELLAVPLVVLGQGVSPSRVTAPVGNVAILPTLLAAAGVPCPECGAEDLRSQTGSGVIDGGLPPDLAFRIAGRYKLVVNLRNHQRELFDRLADPGEHDNIAAAKADLVDTMAAGLNGLAAVPRPDPESVDRLRSLGYIGS